MWKNKNVWILMAGEFIAGLGLWLGIIGNLEFLQKHVPSDFLKSLILFTGLLAGVLVGPLAGRIIDKVEKKKVLIYSSIGRILSVIFMFVALQTDSVIWMIVFMVAIQLSAAFYFPALQSALPLIVRDDELLTLNGFHMNVGTTARIIGTALAGIMLLGMSLFSLYLFSMIAYIGIFLCTLMLTIEESKPKRDKTKIEDKNKGSFKELLPVLKGYPIVVAALVLTIIPILFIGGFNLVVINISELQDDSTIKGLLYTVEGLCFMLGAFIVKRVSEGKNLINLLISCSLIIAISQMFLYFADMRIPTLITFGLFGLAAGFFFPVSATLFQRQIPKEFHGRFFSFRGMLDRVLFQVVLLTTGLLLDTVGLRIMGIVLGTISLILVGYFAMKQVKQQKVGIE